MVSRNRHIKNRLSNTRIITFLFFQSIYFIDLAQTWILYFFSKYFFFAKTSFYTLSCSSIWQYIYMVWKTIFPSSKYLSNASFIIIMKLFVSIPLTSISIHSKKLGLLGENEKNLSHNIVEGKRHTNQY